MVMIIHTAAVTSEGQKLTETRDCVATLRHTRFDDVSRTSSVLEMNKPEWRNGYITATGNPYEKSWVENNVRDSFKCISGDGRYDADLLQLVLTAATWRHATQGVRITGCLRALVLQCGEFILFFYPLVLRRSYERATTPRGVTSPSPTFRRNTSTPFWEQKCTKAIKPERRCPYTKTIVYSYVFTCKRTGNVCVTVFCRLLEKNR
jgi:hypothetical protein